MLFRNQSSAAPGFGTVFSGTPKRLPYAQPAERPLGAAVRLFRRGLSSFSLPAHCGQGFLQKPSLSDADRRTSYGIGVIPAGNPTLARITLLPGAGRRVRRACSDGFRVLLRAEFAKLVRKETGTAKGTTRPTRMLAMASRRDGRTFLMENRARIVQMKAPDLNRNRAKKVALAQVSRAVGEWANAIIVRWFSAPRQTLPRRKSRHSTSVQITAHPCGEKRWPHLPIGRRKKCLPAGNPL